MKKEIAKFFSTSIGVDIMYIFLFFLAELLAAGIYWLIFHITSNTLLILLAMHTVDLWYGFAFGMAWYRAYNTTLCCKCNKHVLCPGTDETRPLLGGDNA